ncbi:MAG: prepilin-type N-terminal cleavage/methylation domain-containing protein [Azonexus sp.]|nr:prepilin-type N-terminal cleavage/methylation domain-containing protein [Azonexus sp.]
MKRMMLTQKNGQRGMGLVEIMVALVIGMVASLVIFQTLKDSGQRAATTTSGGDAQTSGALALHYLEQDIRQAGWGFAAINAKYASNPNGAINCNFGGVWLSAAQNLMPLAIRGGAVAQNQLLVTYGTSSLSTGPGRITRQSATEMSTQNKYGFAKDDRVLILPEAGGTCELTTVSAVDEANSKIKVAPVKSGSVPSKGTIYNLGPGGPLISIDQAPQRIEWSVVGTSLQRRRIAANGATWVANWENSIFDNPAEIMADGIVEMQVRYRVRGRAACELNPAELLASPRAIEGVCIGLLVRSKHYSVTEVTSANLGNVPTWGENEAFAATSGATCADSPNCWENYRYEVFEKVIPMRNMIWGGIS